jgi:hypothetical protein
MERSHCVDMPESERETAAAVMSVKRTSMSDAAITPFEARPQPRSSRCAGGKEGLAVD